MQKIHIEPGCVSCGSCEAICPQVFKLNRTGTIVPNADFEKYKDLIQEAVDLCPVQVIVIDKE